MTSRSIENLQNNIQNLIKPNQPWGSNCWFSVLLGVLYMHCKALIKHISMPLEVATKKTENFYYDRSYT